MAPVPYAVPYAVPVAPVLVPHQGRPYPVASARPLPVHPVAARVLLVIDLLLLLGALLLPLVQDSDGIQSLSVAQYGRPGLAPIGAEGDEAVLVWWMIATFIALLVQAVAVCLALAKFLPARLATVLGILGTFVLAGSLVTVAVVALMVALEPGLISWGLGSPCLVAGEILFLVVMFAPSLVRGWRS